MQLQSSGFQGIRILERNAGGRCGLCGLRRNSCSTLRHIPVLRPLPQRMIDQHQRQKSLRDRRRPYPHTRIVPPMRLDRRGIALDIVRPARQPNA